MPYSLENPLLYSGFCILGNNGFIWRIDSLFSCRTTGHQTSRPGRLLGVRGTAEGHGLRLAHVRRNQTLLPLALMLMTILCDSEVMKCHSRLHLHGDPAMKKPIIFPQCPWQVTWKQLSRCIVPNTGISSITHITLLLPLYHLHNFIKLTNREHPFPFT